LDRVAQELRKKATRNTAVVLHEIRSSSESRKPLIRIGSRSAFSDEGVVPVSSHPADFRRGYSALASDQTGAAAVGIAALFHDLGKATNLFQAKLLRAMKGGEPEADVIRHELFSAAVWDRIFGETSDMDLPSALSALTPEQIDEVCISVVGGLNGWHKKPDIALGFRFLGSEGGLSHLIGMLILTHHRLPSAASDHVTLLGARHVRYQSPLCQHVDLAIAPGTPFWHEGWWADALRKEAGQLKPDAKPSSADIALRASLMFADHLGSAMKREQAAPADHLANTITIEAARRPSPADSLSRHVKRVHRYSRFSHQMTHSLRDRYPALDESVLPIDIARPEVSINPRFSWQAEAAQAARAICEQREGGFFAAILAGTGTGKTRGAPTILANAVMGDVRPDRRYLRMSLGLGLRVLATQSAKEYVQDLGFRGDDVSVLVGEAPLQFPDQQESEEVGKTVADEGSESLLSLPDWLRVEQATGGVPEEGADGEENWLLSLSLNTDRGLPAFLDLVLEKAGRGKESGKRLLVAPIMVGTIDHLMGVAAPVSSRFLLQSLRLMTSDLVLDEIDQFEGEDLAAIGRLVFQAGAVGRRVIIMSATLTPDVAEALHLAYSRGWADYARAHEISPHINVLLCGDAPGSIFTNRRDEGFSELLEKCRHSILLGIRAARPLRRGEILPPCDSWLELVDQVNQSCSRMHDLNAVKIDGYRVSVGMIRMTRISHTTALAVQMQSGDIGGRLRVLVCLHSQIPRLHRSYIETRLKRALTRKRPGPDAGVRSLCQAEGVFDCAAEIGAREIEIVVVTSPVIETGNDLDFDYAILDPISTRSIIQAAGRVRRHRQMEVDHLNVLILGRSPIAMQSGALSMPGVETRSALDTGISVIEQLIQFEKRHFSDLAGEVDFSAVNAAPLLSDRDSFPLRDAEAYLRKQMISTAERDPLGRYLLHANARWNLQMTRTRQFRRAETREVLFCMIGDTLQDAGWYLDLDPGTKNSRLQQVGRDDLHLPDPFNVYTLFKSLTAKAWTELSQGVRDMAGLDISSLLRISIPTYGDDINMKMTYTEFTGFTRGTPEDLCEVFGKSELKQWLRHAL